MNTGKRNKIYKEELTELFPVLSGRGKDFHFHYFYSLFIFNILLMNKRKSLHIQLERFLPLFAKSNLYVQKFYGT